MYVALVGVAVSVIYVPDVGRGFVKDDFTWVVESRCRTLADLSRLLVSPDGFYRPMVSLSFAANEYLSGVNPAAYGATNLALAVLTALGVGWVAALWRLPPAASLLAATLWLFNFHGINMAILWISGRTALLLTLFSVLAAAAALRGRPATTGALAFGAMLSKEEAVLLPVPLLVLLFATRAGRRHVAVTAIGLGIAEAVYFALRIHSGAMTPRTAPASYQFTFDWPQVGTNIVQYADRAGSVTLLAIVLLLTIARTMPAPSSAERRLMLVGIVWALVGFAITIFLPVRSSLYACFPSVGIAWAGAALAAAIWRATPDRRQRSAAIAALILPLALIPIYKARNIRWVELATLTTAVMPGLEQAARAAQEDNILVIDHRVTRANLSAAFDSGIGGAYALLAGRRGSVWLVPPPPGATPEETVRVPDWFHSAWVLQDGRLVRQNSAPWTGADAVVFH